VIFRYVCFVIAGVLLHPACRLTVVLLRVADDWWQQRKRQKKLLALEERARHFTHV